MTMCVSYNRLIMPCTLFFLLSFIIINIMVILPYIVDLNNIKLLQRIYGKMLSQSNNCVFVKKKKIYSNVLHNLSDQYTIWKRDVIGLTFKHMRHMIWWGHLMNMLFFSTHIIKVYSCINFSKLPPRGVNIYTTK